MAERSGGPPAWAPAAGATRSLLRQTVRRDVGRLQVLPLPVLDAVDADDLVHGVAPVVEHGLSERALVRRHRPHGLEDLRAVLLAGLLGGLDDDVHVLVGEDAVLLRGFLVLRLER